jgi:hypothetical protein
MKGVTNYLKNVTKSVAYAAADIGKEELMPNVGEFADNNKQFMAATYSALKNPKVTVRKSVSAIQNSKIYQALDYGVRNTFEDLKTGNFYNKERINRDELKLSGLDDGTDWDDLSEFGVDDDWESSLKDGSSKKEVTAGDMKIVGAIEGSNAAAANATVNAIIKTSEYQTKSSRANMAQLYMQNEKLFGGLHQDFSVMNATLSSIHKVTAAALQNIDKNSSDYYTQQLKLDTERNAILKEMLEMQRNQYMSAEEKEKKNAGRQTKKVRWSDINHGGIPDFDNYFDLVKKNIANELGNMGMPEFSENSNMLATFMTSPLKGAMKYVVNGLIPGTIKAATKELDSSLSGIFGNVIGALGNAREKDGPLGILARILGVNTSVNRTIDTSKYEKGPIPFDGITRKAVTDVIPAYLRRIEAYITGEPEQIYDYKAGKWIHLNTIKQRHDNIRKDAIRQGTSEIREAMSGGIRTAKTHTDPRTAMEIEDAFEEFFEYVYVNNGRFNPKASADKNGIDMATYPNLYKHYKIVLGVFNEFDYSAISTRGGTKAYKRKYSTRMNMSKNVLEAKDNEERQYRALEQEMGPFLEFFSALKIDKHGKWKDNKFTSSDGLLKTKDDKGNTIFTYLQNINKELTWQREYGFDTLFGMGIHGGKPGSGSRGRRPKGSYSDYSDARRSRSREAFSRIDLESSEFKQERARQAAADDKRRKETENRVKRDLSKGKVDMSKFDDLEYAEYVLKLRELLAEGNSEEFKNEVKGYNENAIRKWIDKHLIKTDTKSIKDLREAAEKDGKSKYRSSKNGKDNKNIASRVLDNIHKVGSVTGGLIGASSEILTDIMYNANKAIYDMMYVAEVKDEKTGNRYDGFMNMIANKISDTFETGKSKFKEKIIDPVKKWLGIDENFEKRFKESLTGMGSGLFNTFIDSNKDVWGKVGKKIMTEAGLIDGETIAQKHRKKNREKSMSDINEIESITSILDPRFVRLMAEYDLNFVEYGEDFEAAKKDLLKKAQQEFYKYTKKLKEVSNSDELRTGLSGLSEKEIKDFNIRYGLDESSGLDVLFSRIDTIKRTNPNYNPNTGKDKYGRPKDNDYTTTQKSAFTRTRRNRVLSLAKSGNSSAAVKYAEEQGLTGTIEQKVEIIKRVAEENGKPLSKEHLSHLIIYNEDGSYDEEKTNANLAVNYLRLLRRNFAKGTISKPAIGPSILSKNELLFDSKGTHRVPKTGYYNLKEPTHILNSQDSHSLLSMMGVKGIGAKTTPGEDARKENYVDKKLFGKKYKHADGTIKVTNDGVSVDTKEIMSEAKKYVPEGLAGGLVGGILSMVLGIAGGPILGAAVGGATNIVRSSDSFKNMLFGEKGADGKRTGKGLINSKIVNAVQKYAPDAIKFGMAGILPGLITPLGPIGGLLVGSVVGILKNNEKFKEKYFGKDGKLTLGSKEKNVIKRLLPGAIKGAGIGALSGFVLGGPFGILGNAVIGSAIGMMTTTEDFKESIFGKTINGVKMGGLLNSIKEVFHPLKESFTKLGKSLEDTFDENIIDPLKRFITPFIHQIPKTLGWLPRTLNKVLKDRIGNTTIGRKIKTGINKVGGAVANVTGKAARVITTPFRAVGVVGDKIRGRQIKKGEAEYMTAQERLNFNAERMGDSDYEGKAFDQALTSIGAKGGPTLEQAKEARRNLSGILDTKSSLESAKRKHNKELNKILSTVGDGKISDKAIKAAQNALKNNDLDGAVNALRKYSVTGSKNGLTSEEFDNIMNSAVSSDGKTLKQMLARSQDLNSRLTSVRNMTDDDRNKILQALSENEITKKLDLTDDHKLMQYLKYLDTEIENREANPKDEREVREEKDSENILGIFDLLKDIHENGIKFAIGERDAKVEITDENGNKTTINKTEDVVNKATKRNVDEMKEDENRREEAVAEDLGKAGIDTGKLSDEAKRETSRGTQHHGPGKSIGKDTRNKFSKNIVKAASDGLLTEEEINTISSISNVYDIARNVKRIAVLKKNGFEFNEDETPAIYKFIINSYNYGRLKKLSGRIELKDFLNGAKLTKNDVVLLSEIGGRKIRDFSQRCEILLRNGKSYNDFGSIEAVLNYDIGKETSDSNSLNFKDSQIRTFGKQAFGFKKRKRDDRANQYINPEDTAETEEVKPEHHFLGSLLSGALGIVKDVAGGLFNVGKDIVGGLFNAGKNGVKKLFHKGKNTVSGAASGLMDKVKGAGSGLMHRFTGGGGSNFDETDKPKDGKDVVQLAPGKFGYVKRDSSGNVEPDTSDSKTKQILEDIRKDSESNKKAQEAQIESTKQLKNAFDTSNVKGSENGKFKWWQLLLVGGLLAGSGVLKPLWEKFMVPLWNNHLKPFWNSTVKPWLKKAGKWVYKHVIKPAVKWLWDEVSDSDGDGKSDGVFGLITNIWNGIQDLMHGDGEAKHKAKSPLDIPLQTSDDIMGNTNNGGTTVTLDINNDNTILFDKNGNRISMKDVRDGKVKEVYNDSRVKGAIDLENGTVEFEDPDPSGSTTIGNIAEATGRAAILGTKNPGYKILKRLNNWARKPLKSKKFKLLKKIAKKYIKIITDAPTKAAEYADKFKNYCKEANVKMNMSAEDIIKEDATEYAKQSTSAHRKSNKNNVDDGAKKSAKDIDNATKKGTEEVASDGAKKGAKDIDNATKKGTKEVVEGATKKGAKEVTEDGAKKGAKVISNTIDDALPKSTLFAPEYKTGIPLLESSDNLVQNAIDSGKEAQKTSKLNKLLNAIYNTVNEVFNNLSDTKFVQKLKSVFECFKTKKINFKNWLNGFKTKILNGIKKVLKKILGEATVDTIKQCSEKAAAKLGSGALEKASWIAAAILFIIDFGWGWDNSAVILEIKEPTVYEHFIAAFCNAILNIFIIPSLFPSITKAVASFISKIFDSELEEKQKRLQEEYEAYVEVTGDNASKEEYIKDNYNVYNEDRQIVKVLNNKYPKKWDWKKIQKEEPTNAKRISKNGNNYDSNTRYFVYEVKGKDIDIYDYPEEENGWSWLWSSSPYQKYGHIVDKLHKGDRVQLIAYGVGGTLGDQETIKNSAWWYRIVTLIRKGDNKDTINEIDKKGKYNYGSYIKADPIRLNWWNENTNLDVIVDGKKKTLYKNMNEIKGYNGNPITGAKDYNEASADYKPLEEPTKSKDKKSSGTTNGSFDSGKPDYSQGLKRKYTNKNKSDEKKKKKKSGKGNTENKIESIFGRSKEKENNNTPFNIANIINKTYGKSLINTDSLDTETDDDGVSKARNGKITIFDKEYWGFKDSISTDNTFNGIFKRAKYNIQKIVNAPIMLSTYAIGALASNMSQMGAYIETKYNEIKDSLPTITKTSSGKIEVKSSNASQNKSSTSASTKSKTNTNNNSSKSGGNFLTNTISTVGKIFTSIFGKGTSYVKQTDPSIAGIQFNSNSDSEYQTIGDSGCGPAAAVNAVRSAYGRGSEDLVSAADYALSNGYKETNGGTMPGFFSDYFSKNGLSSQTSYNKSTIANNIKNGNPTVLMGSDSNGVSANTPYGYNPHYVTATGLDSNGHVIIQDPESEYDDQAYSLNDVLNKTSFGVSAFGRNGNKPMARFGGSKFGRSKYGRGKKKIIFIGDSRGVAMKDACGNDGNIWCVEGGRGLNWTISTGIGKINDKVNNDTAIAFMMGVNDLCWSDMWSKYVNFFKSTGKKWVEKGADVYFVSVNPVDAAGYTYPTSYGAGPITNKKISEFNNYVSSKMYSKIKYLDTYSEIIKDFNTYDNLHYDTATTKKIYNLIVKKIKNGTSDTTGSDTSDNNSSTTTETTTTTEKKDNSWISKVTRVLQNSKAGKSLGKIFGAGKHRSKYGRGDESKIWWYLTQKDKFGLTEAGAAGIMGNMEAESGMKANNLEGIYESSLGYNDETYTKAVDDGTYKNFTSDRAGYGLIQFTDKGRWKEPYYNYVKKGKKKRSIGSLSAQLEFLNKDIKKNDKSLYKVLSTTDSTKDATVKWLTDVERCKGYNTSSVQNYRTSLSNKWYKKFTGKEGTPIDTEDVSSDSSSSSKSEEKKESSWIEKVTNVLNKSKAGRVLDKIFGLSSGETTTSSSSSDSNNGSSSKTGEAMVEVAKKEVGNTDYTKYNGHAGAWCADFVSWVAKQVGLSSKVFPPYAGCTSGYQPLIDAGAKEVKLKDGRAGDIIFYSTDGNKNRYHTGILAKVNKNNTISYEGNWSDKVAKVDYQRSKKEWEMYLLRPAYPDVEEDKIMKKTMSKDKIGKKYQYTLTEDAVMYTPSYQPLDEKLPKGTKVVMHRIGKNEGTYAIDYWIDTNGKKHTKKYKGYILTSMQGSVKDRKVVKGKKSGKGTSINLPISDRTINNEAKPMAKFGMHKNSLYGKGTIKYPPRKISTMDAHGNRGTVAISSEDQEAAKLIKSYSRKNVYTNWGLGTNEPTRNNINVQQNYGGGKTTYIFDNTILLNTIVKILYTIADNTDKLNTIVSILNNKLGSSITADDIANASTSDTLKSKLQQSLKNIAGANSQSYNDSTSNDSINNIIMAMNSIASE